MLICSEVVSMKQNIQMIGKFHIRRMSIFFFPSPQGALLQKGGGGTDEERIFYAKPINQQPSILLYLPISYYYYIRLNI